MPGPSKDLNLEDDEDFARFLAEQAGGGSAPSPNEDADLGAWLDREASGGIKSPTDAAQNYAFAHDPERAMPPRQAPLQPAQEPVDYGTGPGRPGALSVGMSALGTFLQGKPFDSGYWSGQNARADRLAQEQQVNQRTEANDAAMQDKWQAEAHPRGVTDPETLRLREEALELQRQRLGQGDAGQDLQRARLGIQQGREGRAAANADPNADPANQIRAFAYGRGVPRGSLDGMSYDAIIKMNPEVGRLFAQAEPQAAREIDIAARKAGAEAAARQPYVQENTQAASDIHEAAASRRLGTGDPRMDDEIAALERQYGITIKEPSLYAAASRGRGRAAMVKDWQNQDQLGKASRDMLDVRDELAAGPKNGEDGDDFLARLNSKYNFAKDKATKALVALGGSEAQQAVEHSEAQWPSKLSLYARPALEGAIEELDRVRQSKIGVYGGDVHPREEGDGYTVTPFDPSASPDALPVAPLPPKPAMPRRAHAPATAPPAAPPAGAVKHAYSPSKHMTFWLDAKGQVIGATPGDAR